jgi:hypothetical protein
VQPRQSSFSLTIRALSGIRTHSARVQLLARRKSERFRNSTQRQRKGAGLPLIGEITIASANTKSQYVYRPLSVRFSNHLADWGGRCGGFSKDQRWLLVGFRRLTRWGIFPGQRKESTVWRTAFSIGRVPAGRGPMARPLPLRHLRRLNITRFARRIAAATGDALLSQPDIQRVNARGEKEAVKAAPKK